MQVPVAYHLPLDTAAGQIRASDTCIWQISSQGEHLPFDKTRLPGGYIDPYQQTLIFTR
ncbi:hypothetical protein [Alcanivorax quisquiliarum]|uniref:Uncharacterized protein n=1 Tax=Alcanivorax quisquiliarum TaxID=2933565 RepID=A0ABT0EA47_9GAMM|nr:hypothetical protein [Alcanivorax quisquiliarum]MCK0538669.1 hypothetical protein [Alcanivorax quisquiliarum]